MLSTFWKKSPRKGDALRPGITSMPYELRQKFKSGVNYNLKILLRGDRNVGKSCLVRRLQGDNFFDQYQPTEEIEVASIGWNYKATDDVVKVEIWDVVDNGRRRRPIATALKLDNNDAQTEEVALDASFVDVLKGANGVIVMFDITKAWTWEYTKRQLALIPSNLPTLVLGNRRDMSNSRSVDENECRKYISQYKRGSEDAPLLYTECSMLTGQGLKFLYAFFNVPFLLVEREALTRRLNRNEEEMKLSFVEMALYDTVTTCESVASTSPNSQPAKSVETGCTSLEIKESEKSASVLQGPDLNSWLEEGEPTPSENNKNSALTPEDIGSDSDDDRPNPLVTQIPSDDSFEQEEEKEGAKQLS